MSRFDGGTGGSNTAEHELAYSYVLVADGDVHRAAACVREAAKTFGIGILVARDADEALGIIAEFGPPRLLIADLSLPGKGGFAVVDALGGAGKRRVPVIAWSGSRELREFAMHRLAQHEAKVLGPAVAPDVLRNAVAWARRTADAAAAGSAAVHESAAENLEQRIAALGDEARQVCGASGAAVYFRPAGETHFRVSVSWTSDAPMPPSPDLLPRTFERILNTGEAIVIPDVSAAEAPDREVVHGEDSVRGFAAVPVLGPDGGTVGAIFVFDVKPLTLGDDEVNALKALGRAGARRAAVPHAQDEAAATEGAPASEPPVEAPDWERQPPPLIDRASAAPAAAREMARARRDQLSLSVILFEAQSLARRREPVAVALAPDAFRNVATTLSTAMRGSDLAIRWSDRQLLVVVTGLQERSARQVAERLRAAMQAGSANRIAVSGAVAEFGVDDTFDAVVARAADRLQMAAARGGNRIA